MLKTIKNEYTKLFAISVLSLVFCFPSLESFGQSKRHLRKVKAVEDVYKIKTNGLVITFKTRKPLLDKLNEMGMTERALEIESEVEAYNRSIKFYFTTYSYGPLYFTNTEDLYNARNSSELIVTDRNGNKVTVNPDEVLYLDTEEVFLEAFGMLSKGFGVHDKNHVYLKRPFPYYIHRLSYILNNRKGHEVRMMKVLEKRFKRAENLLF
jgi:hypothetical protein